MKVRELMAALAALPPEAAELEVFVWDAGDRLRLTSVDSSFMQDEYAFIDINTDTDEGK